MPPTLICEGPEAPEQPSSLGSIFEQGN
jgi:hypothetical protein